MIAARVRSAPTGLRSCQLGRAIGRLEAAAVAPLLLTWPPPFRSLLTPWLPLVGDGVDLGALRTVLEKTDSAGNPAASDGMVRVGRGTGRSDSAPVGPGYRAGLAGVPALIGASFDPGAVRSSQLPIGFVPRSQPRSSRATDGLAANLARQRWNTSAAAANGGPTVRSDELAASRLSVRVGHDLARRLAALMSAPNTRSAPSEVTEAQGFARSGGAVMSAGRGGFPYSTRRAADRTLPNRSIEFDGVENSVEVLAWKSSFGSDRDRSGPDWRSTPSFSRRGALADLVARWEQPASEPNRGDPSLARALVADPESARAPAMGANVGDFDALEPDLADSADHLEEMLDELLAREATRHGLEGCWQ